MLKFIGQHIVDLIARFRSDVYLEDVSSGTIASGSNLGLDSNNKIVKANVPTGDITSVGISISGTSVTDSVASGDANIFFSDGEGIDLTSSTLGSNSLMLSIAGEDASTSNKGVASFNSSNFSVSSGAVSLSTGQDSNVVKQICTTHHCFTTVSGGSSSQDYWVPFIGQSEQAAPNNTHRTVAPYDGLIKKVVVHADVAFGSSAQVRYHKINGGDTDDFANDNSTDDTTTNVTVDLSTAYTAAVANFSSGNTFSAGDQVGVSLVRDNTALADVAMTIVWEYTIS